MAFTKLHRNRLQIYAYVLLANDVREQVST
jgi:hypothetical protein